MIVRKPLPERQYPPCSLCHFCRRAYEVRGVEHGGYCLWFDLEIIEEDLDLRQSPLRLACRRDGDHFLWRLDDTDPIALVAWKKSLFDQQTLGRHRTLTLTISLLALFLSLLSVGSRLLEQIRVGFDRVNLL